MSELAIDKRMKQLHSDISNSYSLLNVSLFAFDCIGEPQSEDGQATVAMLRKIKAEQLQMMQFLCDIMNPLDRLLDSRFDMAAEAEADLGEIVHKGEKVTVKIKMVRGESE